MIKQHHCYLYNRIRMVYALLFVLASSNILDVLSINLHVNKIGFKSRDWERMKTFKTCMKTHSIPSFFCTVVGALSACDFWLPSFSFYSLETVGSIRFLWNSASPPRILDVLSGISIQVFFEFLFPHQLQY